MENDIVLMQEGKRASKPAGFSLRECWADALDFDPTSARGQAAAYMYRYVMDGVRIMLKFEEWDHMPARVEVIRRRIARARSYGCDIHLCIDWFKVATGPGSYHKGMWKPSTNTMIDMVAEMLDEFEPDIVEVCNEPYYVKGGKYTAKQYVNDVTAYVLACEEVNFKGKVLASGTRQEVGWKIEDGWEWHAKRWERGMLEGKHTLVLHELKTPAQVRSALIDGFHNGKAVGYQWPVYESEYSGVGRSYSTDSVAGAEMTMAGYHAARDKRFPLAYLTMGGGWDGYGDPSPSGWRMQTDLINKHGELSLSAKMLAAAENAPPFVLDPPDIEPPPPPPPGGGGGWHSIVTDNAHLKFTNPMAKAALAVINSGDNHFPVSEVALGPSELAALQRQLTRIVGG